MNVEWGLIKALLLFVGLVLKGTALAEPLPLPHGTQIKAVSAVLWPAFDGAFFWLLKPPSQNGEEPGGTP